MGDRAVVVCADDYGMSAGVSRGILALADDGRISATSVMANLPGTEEGADDLVRLAGRVGIGLHLTLTWGAPLGLMPIFAPHGAFPALGTVLRLALAGRLPTDEIRAEVARQIARFEALFGRPPDFLDGHQHVHALPGIRDAVVSALAGRSVWVRQPADRPDRILRRGGAAGKALTVAGLAVGFEQRLAAAGLQANAGFAGFSDFRPSRDLGREFGRFLVAPGRRHLVMCHPGETEEGVRLDGIVEARAEELDFLGSPEWRATLRRHGASLVARPD